MRLEALKLQVDPAVPRMMMFWKHWPTPWKYERYET